MIPWIPLEASFTTNPKTEDLAIALGISPTYARGHLTDLACWAANHFELGVLQGQNIETKIARNAGWMGDPSVFVNALIACGFLHWMEDANKGVCLECFPPKRDGTPYEPMSGYGIHGWRERVRLASVWQERENIMRTAARERQWKSRGKRRGLADATGEYQIRRGLRAAPTIVDDRFCHAWGTVTSHAEKCDVTLSDFGKVLPNIREVQQHSDGASVNLLPNIREAQLDSPECDIEKKCHKTVTNEQRNIREYQAHSVKHVTNVSQNDQKNVKIFDINKAVKDQDQDVKDAVLTKLVSNYTTPSVKDTSGVVKDRDKFKTVRGRVREDSNEPAKLTNDGNDQKGAKKNAVKKLVSLWRRRFREKMGTECPDDLRPFPRWRRIWNEQGFSDEEIERRIETFFSSTFSQRKGAIYFFSRFAEVFWGLENGPIDLDKAITVKGRQQHGGGGYDRITGEENYPDDF